MLHYHAGHNIAGYLPMDDENYAYPTFSDALGALVDDLEYAWDDGTDEQYLEAYTEMYVAPGPNFLTYTATHPDTDHDLPTAWWVVQCSESECEGNREF